MIVTPIRSTVTPLRLPSIQYVTVIPKRVALGQMFLVAFTFLGQHFSYAIPLQGMTLSMEFLVSLSV